MLAKNNALVGWFCDKTRKQRLYFAVALSLVGAIVIVALRVSPVAVEPEFDGRPLSSWLEMKGGIEPLPEEAREAVRHMGTNALPHLIDLLNHEDSWIRAFLYRSLPGAGEFGGGLRSRLTPYYVIQERGAEGIKALGPSAASVLPLLLRKLTNCPNADPLSGEAMAAITPEGPRLLVSALTNSCPEVRRVAAMGLANLEHETDSVLPALKLALHDPDRGVREAVEESLRCLAQPENALKPTEQTN